jgi:hypothetical protein
LDVIMREVMVGSCPDISLPSFDKVYGAKLAHHRQLEAEQQQQQQCILQARQQQEQQWSILAGP